MQRLGPNITSVELQSWAGGWREAKIYNFNKFHHDHLISSLSFENHDHKCFSSKKGKITKRTSYFFFKEIIIFGQIKTEGKNERKQG